MVVAMAHLESIEPTGEIAEVERSLPAPPSPGYNDRKTLPPLPLSTEKEVSSFRASKSIHSIISRENSFKSLSPATGGPDKELPLPFGIKATKPHPSRTLSGDEHRPMTASTKRLSFSSTVSKPMVKYGTGKYARVELSPQPSNDPDDPLNWPTWRKNLNFFALLSMVAFVGAMKTVYITCNSSIAIEEGISYTAAVGLTAIPLMVSALSGAVSMVVARIWGKRPVYLVATVLMFIGVVWNTQVMGDLGQNMVARILQGIGWGAFDTLVLGSIQDTYFAHERQPMVLICNAVSVATTWGSPLLGGVASEGATDYTLQFGIIAFFLAFSIPLIALGAPETTFTRSASSSQSAVDGRAPSFKPEVTEPTNGMMAYFAKMKPWSYQAHAIDSMLLMQAPRAMLAPTTGLLFVATLLPYVSLWGLASSLSLLFSSMPFMLSKGSLGAIMAGPFLFATILAVALALPAIQKRFTAAFHLSSLAVGSVLAAVGIFAFGFYLEGDMHQNLHGEGSSGVATSMWEIGSLGADLSLPAISFLLGLLAAGSLVLDATIRPMIQRSAIFNSANTTVGQRGAADMQAGLTCLRNFVAGAFIFGIPNLAWDFDDLKAATTGLGVTQLLVAAAVCGAWWFWEENVRRLDGRVMGLPGANGLKHKGSFFDTS